MAFSIVKKTLPPLLVFLCLNIITNKTEAVNIREKCMCIQQTEAVLWGRVKDFSVINSGPHCNKDQIIIKMQSKSVCLAPNSKQGKKLQKCWKRINFNKGKKKACLQQRKVKRKQKKSKTP
ncbi:chemokine (C-X-C motif) ligand 18a, duplicate 1 [Clarias gariepinus]|uniref:chemokine (C-X-C motif) ligand 18a, duplicate 1 n=1 Tax=Clarias gariepinus TaxID=13013 RepID=UPI00234C329F|nr:chemokine (C-X-C motif) ligand 18a, duplicate 1 [Clarias gariepinus]